MPNLTLAPHPVVAVAGTVVAMEAGTVAVAVTVLPSPAGNWPQSALPQLSLLLRLPRLPLLRSRPRQFLLPSPRSPAAPAAVAPPPAELSLCSRWITGGVEARPSLLIHGCKCMLQVHGPPPTCAARRRRSCTANQFAREGLSVDCSRG